VFGVNATLNIHHSSHWTMQS